LTAHKAKLERQLTTLALVFVMFFTTSGGAYTIEGLVAAVGPGLALLTLFIVPIIWSIPETLIVAELASMLPEEGGYYRWVHRAFGPFWGFQNGWATWLYSLVDLAIYPVLFNQYLTWFFPTLGTGTHWAVSLAMIWGAAAINLRGALPVGRVSIVAGSFVLAAFAALAVFAIPHATHAPWAPFAAPGTTIGAGLAVGLATVVWNYSGWDNASTVQGEVIDASRSYPRALFLALPLVALGYFVPLLPALAATDYTMWHEGGWPAIAVAAAGTAGPYLAAWLALAGMVSALALFNALLLSNSRVPLAMAEDGFLPRAIATSRGHRAAIALQVVLALAMLWSLPFQDLMTWTGWTLWASSAATIAGLVRVRLREGALAVPVPGWPWVPALYLVVSLSIGAFSFERDRAAGGAVLGALGVAALLYFALPGSRRARGSSSS